MELIVNCLILGDQTGKTSLIWVLNRKGFPQNWSPSIFECIDTRVPIDENNVHLKICDLNGSEDYKPVRLEAYKMGIDVVLLCFAIDSPLTFKNINFWMKELKKCFNPMIPIVLVATKSDLREDKKSKKVLVNINKAKELAKKINAFAYLECSAKNKQGVLEVFQAAVRAALEKKEKSKCIIM